MAGSLRCRVGQEQSLPKPLLVTEKKSTEDGRVIEVVAFIKTKILFSKRPTPFNRNKRAPV